MRCASLRTRSPPRSPPTRGQYTCGLQWSSTGIPIDAALRNESLASHGQGCHRPTYGSHQRRPAVLLRDPYTATPDEPFVYAVVPNHPADVQVETVLSTLAQMLARSQLVDVARKHGVTDLDRQAREVDRQAHEAVQDAMRARGWPAAAEALQARSAAAGRPLVVRYDPIAFDESGLRRRVPVLRHVYNAMPEARVVID